MIEVCYEGSWKSGLKHGTGTYSWGPKGRMNTLVGKFDWGKQVGFAKITYSNGDVYEGELVSGLKSGRGKYTYSNGDTFEGNWVNNKIQNGVFIDHNNKCQYRGDYTKVTKVGIFGKSIVPPKTR